MSGTSLSTWPTYSAAPGKQLGLLLHSLELLANDVRRILKFNAYSLTFHRFPTKSFYFCGGAPRFDTQDSAHLNGQRDILARLLKKGLGEKKNDFLANRDHLEVGFRKLLEISEIS